MCQIEAANRYMSGVPKSNRRGVTILNPDEMAPLAHESVMPYEAAPSSTQVPRLCSSQAPATKDSSAITQQRVRHRQSFVSRGNRIRED